MCLHEQDFWQSYERTSISFGRICPCSGMELLIWGELGTHLDWEITVHFLRRHKSAMPVHNGKYGRYMPCIVVWEVSIWHNPCHTWVSSAILANVWTPYGLFFRFHDFKFMLMAPRISQAVWQLSANNASTKCLLFALLTNTVHDIYAL